MTLKINRAIEERVRLLKHLAQHAADLEIGEIDLGSAMIYKKQRNKPTRCEQLRWE